MDNNVTGNISAATTIVAASAYALQFQSAPAAIIATAADTPEPLEVVFPKSPEGTLMASQNAAAFEAALGVRATVFSNDSVVVVELERLSPTSPYHALPTAKAVRMTSPSIGGVFPAWSCRCLDGERTASADGTESSLVFKGDRMRLEFVPSSGPLSIPAYRFSHNSSVVSMLTDPQTQLWIGPEQSVPRFSVGVFDDAAYANPRLVRFGVPVISTVPVSATTGSLSATDLAALQSGKGLPSRTMYFRIVSDQPIPTTVPLTLYVSVPSGSGGLGAPQPFFMTPIGATGGTASTFSASRTFFVEDGSANVDGFIYFSVYTPLTKIVSVPFGFDTA